MDKLIKLLDTYRIYFTKEELEEIKEQDGYIDLVKKAYGDSYGRPTEEVFGDDYPKSVPTPQRWVLTAVECSS